MYVENISNTTSHYGITNQKEKVSEKLKKLILKTSVVFLLIIGIMFFACFLKWLSPKELNSGNIQYVPLYLSNSDSDVNNEYFTKSKKYPQYDHFVGLPKRSVDELEYSRLCNEYMKNPTKENAKAFKLKAKSMPQLAQFFKKDKK
jgi:hypothetical protein